MTHPNGWSRYEEYVLRELERLGDAVERIDASMGRQESAISALKVRSGVWGFVAGLLPAIAAAIWMMLRVTS